MRIRNLYLEFRLSAFLCRLSVKPQGLVVEGHTDNTGTVAQNETLSEGRASGVASYIQKKLGTTNNSITRRGRGSTRPVANNHTALGRQLNRRVEIFIYIRR